MYHNIERRERNAFWFGAAKFIGYGKDDNFYIVKAERRSEGYYGHGFRKGTMSRTHLIRAKTLREMGELIERNF